MLDRLTNLPRYSNLHHSWDSKLEQVLEEVLLQSTDRCRHLCTDFEGHGTRCYLVVRTKIHSKNSTVEVCRLMCPLEQGLVSGAPS